MARILGLGDNTIDTYVDRGLEFPGGNAVNVAVMAHRLGADAAYLGCVGDDQGGDLLRAALEAEGVDSARLRRRPGSNARAWLAHDAGDRRFLRSDPGVRADYRLEAEDLAYIAGFDLVHTSIFGDLGTARDQVRTAARRLAFDFSTRTSEDILGRFTPGLDFAFLSAADRSDHEAEELVRRVISLGAGCVVVTRGAAGALAGLGAQRTRQPALPTRVVDTLGAGDGLIAGFLVAVLDGASLDEALRAGAAFAGRVCTWDGGFGHGRPWPGDKAGAVSFQSISATADRRRPFTKEPR